MRISGRPREPLISCGVNRVNLSLVAVASLAAGGFLFAIGGLMSGKTPASSLAPALVRSPGELPPAQPARATLPPAGASGALPAAPVDARQQLYDSVDALLKASEFEAARRLLDEEPARFDEDSAPRWRDMEQSYRLLVDCLERPSAKLRARAEAFLLVSEASRLKPRISAACSAPH